MNQLWHVPVLMVLFGFLFRNELFRLAERLKRRHSGAAAAASAPLPGPPDGSSAMKEETTMDHKDGVAALLHGATGAADAMTDCGIDCDDTELVSQFIAGMDECRAQFEKAIANAMDMARAQGITEDQLENAFDATNKSMQMSPSFSNTWFLWRLASAFKDMASKDVLDAARVAVRCHAAMPTTLGVERMQLNSAMAKLAAALPKER